MTACLGPHMPFSLVPALHINSPSRIDMLPRPLTCGDYPTPRNPFYDVKSDPVSGLPKIPDKPIYSDSWEDRMKERDRVGKFLREASGDALERTGLAALGYTHNGLGPVPPLTIDTDSIRGKGRPEVFKFLQPPKEALEESERIWKAVAERAYKPGPLSSDLVKPTIELPVYKPFWEIQQEMRDIQNKKAIEEFQKAMEECGKKQRETYLPKSWKTVSGGEVIEKASFNYPERIFEVPSMNTHAHIGVTKTGKEFLALRPSDDPTSEHLTSEYPRGFFPDLQKTSVPKKDEERDDKGNLPGDPDYCPRWIIRGSIAHWLWRRW